jgi:hypothetical protein
LHKTDKNQPNQLSSHTGIQPASRAGKATVYFAAKYLKPLKQARSFMDWDEHLSELEIRLLKRSLVWPTPFLKQVFGSDCKRIPHQKTNSLLEQESVQRWAERVYLEIF